MKGSLYIFFCFLSIAFAGQGLKAQYSLQVSGRIQDASGSVVANQEVGISGFSINPSIFISDTTQTDSNGFYIFAFNLPNLATGTLILQTTDCQQNGNVLLTDSINFSINNPTFVRDFSYCENSCVANFSFQQRGLGVVFSDNSTSPYFISFQSWDFGDGDTANGTSVFHVYEQEGTYVVCLSIFDSTGCSNTFCDSLTVEQCEADFNWENNFALEGRFTALPSVTPTPSYEWNFGDGTLGTGSPTIHTYGQEGNYPVQLILIDSAYNCRDTATRLVNIQGDANCMAAFNPIFLARDSIRFENLSQSSKASSNFISYQWTFGDQGLSQDSSPTHVYQDAGDYLVCLLVEDDFGCRDSLCQTLTILPGPVCDPSFVYSSISNLTVAFSALEIIPSNQYSWDLEDGSSYTGPAFFHTFSRPGTYEVCLQVIDSSGNCRDSLCEEIILNPNELCISEFVWNQLDSNRFAFYQLAAISTPANASFNWDFGDGTGSTSPNPIHTYSGNGPWLVCLLVEDGLNGCVQETCYEIRKDALPRTLFDLKGWVYEDGIPSFDSRVLLYKDQPQQALINRVGDREVNFDIYEWNNLEAGSYLVYAEHEGEGNYIPTYLGGEIHWQDAISSIINNSHVVNPRLDMVAGINLQGMGSIEGKIFEGLNQNDGPALEDEVVLLLADDANRSPISYRRTKTDGTYLFDGLPLGTYWVQPEIPGIYAAPRQVVIATPTERISNLSFGIGEQFGFPTEIEEKVALRWRISPNPANEFLEVFSSSQKVSIRIVDLVGKQLFVREGGCKEGCKIRTADWPEGVYVVEVEGNGKVQRKRLLVSH